MKEWLTADATVASLGTAATGAPAGV
jgi:hypothetical protein